MCRGMGFRYAAFGIAALVVSIVCLSGGPCLAEDKDVPGEYLNIATTEFRPLSIDRLLYTAFQDVDFRVTFTTTSLKDGYDMANDGECDGVITMDANMEEKYPNLRRVPVPLERLKVCAFASKDRELAVGRWGDLSGLKVGMLAGRTYLPEKLPKDAQLVTGDDVNSLTDGLVKGECDVVILVEREHAVLGVGEGVKKVGQIEEGTEYLYLNKKRELLVPTIAEAVGGVFADGRGERLLNDVPLGGVGDKKTVLHIVSTNMEIHREERFYVRLKSWFTDDDSIEWYSVALNSKRFSKDPHRLVYFSHLLRQDCLTRDIAAIIVSGEEAFEFVKGHYFLYFRNVPVLFYGIGGDYGQWMEGYEDYATGVVEQVFAYETVSEALKLFPNTKRVHVVNDYLPEGEKYREAMKEQLEFLTDRVEVTYNENVDRSVMLAEVEALPSDAIVLVGSYFSDASGQYYPLNEMKRALEESCRVPIFSVFSLDVDYNAIGGAYFRFENCADSLAGMLRSILDGVAVRDLPTDGKGKRYNQFVFDKNQLEFWGIKERELPRGSRIINRVPGMWESNPMLTASILSSLVLSVLVILGLAYFVRKYHKQNVILLETRKHLHTAEEMLVKDATIKEAKTRLENIINTAPVAFSMSVGGKVVVVNDYMRQRVGMELGQSIDRYYADAGVREGLLEQCRQGDVTNETLRLNLLDGESHRFLANVSTTELDEKQAYILWATDIEEHERQKDQLELARGSLQAIVDALPLPVCIVGVEDLQLQYGNDAFLDLLAFESAKRMEGVDFADVLVAEQGDDADSKQLAQAMVHTTVPIKMEVKVQTRLGKTISVLLRIRAIDYFGKESAICMITDLTAEKEYQRLLRNTAKKEKEANQLKSRFLVNMSHEIRTPMNAIIGLTEIELRKGASKESEDVFRKVNYSAKNLLQIINDILDLSKIEADKMEFFYDEFELEEALNSALLVASPRLNGKNVEFMVNYSLDLPRFVIGERTRLWQILKNFLDNSAKYTNKGKIVVDVFEMVEQSNEREIHIAFIIQDTGIGMKEEQLQRIFVPYKQFYSEAQRTYTGTGLGMPISKQLCERLGGSMQIESEEGVGTTIRLTMPFKRSENKEKGAQAFQSPTLANLNVLVVDDDDLSLQIMASLLHNNDANCTKARSGEEALEILFRGDNSFDVILLDYMMDGMNGLEAARRIQTGMSRAPKLLMVTAYQRELLSKELEDGGIEDVIEKPFIPSHFIRKISKIMGGGASESEKLKEKEYAVFQGAKVLLCEDYKLNQEVAVGMFQQFGVEPLVVDDGKKGVHAVLEGDGEFDLVFMDLQMPVMDGYEATRLIRGDARFRELPIVSLTADAMTEIVDRCLEAGMNDHLTKPIDFDELHEIFLKWLPKEKRVEGGRLATGKKDAREEAIARFGGDVVRYKKALWEFALSLPERWPTFSYAAGEGVGEMARRVHQWKGAAGNLAISDIYQYAIEFEKSLRTGNPNREAYGRLIRACQEYRDKVESQEEVEEEVRGQVASTEEWEACLMEWGEALSNYDPVKSGELVERMKGRIWPVEAGKWKELCELAMNYEFESALGLLESMGGKV